MSVTNSDIDSAIVKANAERLANALNNAFANSKSLSSAFEILSPVSTSCKNVKGMFITAPLYAGQKFGLTSAYVGKKNDVILVFTPKSPVTEYKFMEMKLDTALLNFDPSLKNYISELAKYNFTTDKVDIKTSAELVAAQKQQRMTDPRFGAW